MEAARGGISALVPVKGRVGLLEELLASLDAARGQCSEPFETIVVDDSGAAEAEAHRANCARHGATYLRGPEGVGTKRNLGARHARYGLLLLIDSDCVADPALLRRHLELLVDREAGAAAAIGVTELSREEGADSLSLRLLRRSEILDRAFDWARHFQRVTWGMTSNMVIRKEAFDAVGGFCETPLTKTGGEDVDLGVRLTEAGYTIACNPEAVVLHSPRTRDDLAGAARRLFVYGRAASWLCHRHPARTSFRLNPIATLALAAPLSALAGRSARRRAAGVGAVAALLLAWDAQRHLLPGDGVVGAGLAVGATLLDWCFHLGEVVGAVQLRRPGYAFRRFQFFDRGFVPRP